MAGQRSTGSPKGIQLDITNFTQRVTPVSSSPLSVETWAKNNKRQRNSPESDPRKWLAMDSNTGIPQTDENIGNQTDNLPPELKLLYVSLTKMVEQKMQPIEKIENDMKTLLKDRELLPEYVQKVQNLEQNTEQLNSKEEKTEQKNKELKQKLVKIEDKLLENNLIISGVEEPKFEEDGPCRDKLDIIIVKTLPGETNEEKLEKAKKLDIVSTAHFGKYNPIKARPISVTFVKKADADHVYNSKKLLGKGVNVDREYSSITEAERKGLRPILRAARRLEEYRGLCKLEGTELTNKGKSTHLRSCMIYQPTSALM